MTAYPTDFRGWLAKLISFDTVSRNSNLGLVHYVRDYLHSVGVTDVVLVHSPEKTHANLFATLPGEGGVTQGGIVLSGHSDVVPVDGQPWDTDPFAMVEKDGKLFGRGACDMKGFLAVVMALVPTFLATKRAKPVHIAFSYDEEVGCTGVPSLIEHLKQKGFKADGCLVGEPTDMKVYTGNKGYYQWNTSVKGKAIHSSLALMNTSCNAIEYAAQIITKVREMAIDLRDNEPRDPDYTCPFSCITTGLIKGGIAVNTVPEDCQFTCNIRVSKPGVAEDVEQRLKTYIENTIVPEMKKECPEAYVKLVRHCGFPAFNASEDAPMTKHARRLCKDHDVHKVGGGTEAGFFQEFLSIPTVIVGPGPGAMAHLANEYVLVSQMEESMRFTLDLVKLYTEPQPAGKL